MIMSSGWKMLVNVINYQIWKTMNIQNSFFFPIAVQNWNVYRFEMRNGTVADVLRRP